MAPFGLPNLPIFGPSRKHRAVVAKIQARQAEAAAPPTPAPVSSPSSKPPARGHDIPRHASDPGTRPRGDEILTHNLNARPPSPAPSEDGFHPHGLFPIDELIPFRSLFGSSRAPSPPRPSPVPSPVAPFPTLRTESPEPNPSASLAAGANPASTRSGETGRIRSHEKPVATAETKRWRRHTVDTPPAPSATTAAASRSSAPTRLPSGWSLAPTATRRERDLAPASAAKLDTFRRLVSEGYHPKDAADLTGDCRYAKLQGVRDLFEIRLNGHDRATFLVDKADKQVRIMEIGGHT